MSDPCQYCMGGRSLGAFKAQLVLFEGSWEPWPLVMPRPAVPTILADVCPVCDTERFNTEEVPRLNARMALP